MLDRFEREEGFTQVDLQRRNTAAELDRIRDAVTDPHILAAVQQYGLAEFLGAGPVAVDKFERGETTEPVGYALVRAAVDWRRSGLTRAIPKPVLLTPALASIYLAVGPEEPRSQEALDQGLRWATEEINESVALLGRRFPDPAAPQSRPSRPSRPSTTSSTTSRRPVLLCPSSCGKSASTRPSRPSG